MLAESCSKMAKSSAFVVLSTSNPADLSAIATVEAECFAPSDRWASVLIQGMLKSKGTKVVTARRMIQEGPPRLFAIPSHVRHVRGRSNRMRLHLGVVA
jgi:hypothetical protein